MNYERLVAVLSASILLSSSSLGAHKHTISAALSGDAPMITASSSSDDGTQVSPEGTFVDATGVKHHWKISSHHELTWDARPYIPMGGRFVPKSWDRNATVSDWTDDKAELATLKREGIADLYLSPGELGISGVPHASVQRIVDYLDANGFRYGIELLDFPSKPLVGFLVKPTALRQSSPGQNPKFTNLQLPVSAVYALVSAPDGEILKTGTANVDPGGTAEVSMDSAPGDVLLLYPQETFFPGTTEGHLPDLWQGFDEYRDDLLVYLKKVKLGPGFRYFINPITEDLGVQGDAATVIPTSEGFRLEFDAWLSQTYGDNINDLIRSWGETNQSLPDFATAARCFPLWSGSKGVPDLFDPNTGKTYEIDNKPAVNDGFWNDLRKFRTSSVRGYAESIADALKNFIADVPVVYSASKEESIFESRNPSGGFDGLAMSMQPGTDGTPVAVPGVYAMAQINARSLWLIGASPEVNADAGITAHQPATQSELNSEFDSLQNNGARGFMTVSLQDQSGASTAPTTVSNNVLSWMSNYEMKLSDRSDALEQDPLVLWYPKEAIVLGAVTKVLSTGVHWLETSKPGHAFTFGPDLCGYYIDQHDGNYPAYVIWSPDNKMRVATFELSKSDLPMVEDSAGFPIKVTHKKELWSIPVSSEPVQVTHVATLPLPQNTLDNTIADIDGLIAEAKLKSVPVTGFKDRLFFAENSMTKSSDNVETRYDLLRKLDLELRAILRPYVWVEAESADASNGWTTASSPSASAGSFLALKVNASDAVSSSGGYTATYQLNVNAPGEYEVWFAGSPLNGRTNSAFAYTVNDSVPVQIQASDAVGKPYSDGFTWTKLGSTRLRGGRNSFTVTVNKPNKSDKVYRLDMDAFCFSKDPFVPHGTVKPDDAGQ